MIQTIYPEPIQAQLDLIDEKIEKIYAESYPESDAIPNVYEANRIKKNLYEKTRPLLDEKVRLIANSCPKYVIKGGL